MAPRSRPRAWGSGPTNGRWDTNAETLAEEPAHIYSISSRIGENGAIEMPVTKLDDKGRILLSGDKIDLRSLLNEAIEKAKGINHEKVEREIEEESNQLARKRFEVCPR
jgi:hypothetical protein